MEEENKGVKRDTITAGIDNEGEKEPKILKKSNETEMDEKSEKNDKDSDSTSLSSKEGASQPTKGKFTKWVRKSDIGHSFKRVDFQEKRKQQKRARDNKRQQEESGEKKEDFRYTRLIEKENDKYFQYYKVITILFTSTTSTATTATTPTTTCVLPPSPPLLL